MCEHVFCEIQMLIGRMRARADAGDALVHEGRRVGHRADDRNPRRQPCLDLRGRNGRGNRENGLLGRE